MTTTDWLAPHRRALQLALGLIWLVDAALQYQPYMFTSAFSREVLAPVGPGNPGWIAHPVHWSAHLTATNVVVLNAMFATTQLLIALGLFTRPTVRLALVGSGLWALGVWWMGEGLGGLLVAPQSPIMGAPGAALLYVLVSILIWPPSERTPLPRDGAASVATTGPVRGLGGRLLWLVLWGSFAFESVQASNRAPSALHDAIAGMQDGEPAWIRAIDRAGAHLIGQHGTGASVVLAVLFALIALAVFRSSRVLRIALIVATVFVALTWVVAQDFGEIATGEATDPNTGPLLVLLAVAYWPFRPAPSVGESRKVVVRETVAAVPVQGVA